MGTRNIRRKKTGLVVLGSLSRPLIRDHGAPFSRGRDGRRTPRLGQWLAWAPGKTGLPLNFWKL